MTANELRGFIESILKMESLRVLYPVKVLDAYEQCAEQPGYVKEWIPGKYLRRRSRRAGDYPFRVLHVVEAVMRKWMREIPQMQAYCGDHLTAIRIGMPRVVRRGTLVIPIEMWCRTYQFGGLPCQK